MQHLFRACMAVYLSPAGMVIIHKIRLCISYIFPLAKSMIFMYYVDTIKNECV